MLNTMSPEHTAAMTEDITHDLSVLKISIQMKIAKPALNTTKPQSNAILALECCIVALHLIVVNK